MRFPTVSGSNLSRKKYNLPDDFEEKYNLVIIPFKQWQQWVVNTWAEFAQQLESDNRHLRTYELPTIQNLNRFSQKFINEGMRAGIPDQKLRDRVITLYIDKASFRRSLGIPHEEDVFIYLVDRAGNVLWNSRGELTTEKKQSLLQSMEQLCINSQNYQPQVFELA
jgi:ATP10 protein